MSRNSNNGDFISFLERLVSGHVRTTGPLKRDHLIRFSHFKTKQGASRLNYSTKFLVAEVGIQGKSPDSISTKEFLWGVREVSCQEEPLIPTCRIKDSLCLFSLHITGFFFSFFLFNISVIVLSPCVSLFIN